MDKSLLKIAGIISIVVGFNSLILLTNSSILFTFSLLTLVIISPTSSPASYAG